MKPKTPRAKRPPKQSVYSESAIEEQILYFLTSQGVSCEKVSSEWYFDTKKQIFRKRKSAYSRSGTSDIHGCIEPYWRALYIEVKTSADIHFFDRPVVELLERYAEALGRGVDTRKYLHAVEQWNYIEEKIKAGAVAFFADSTNTVIEKLRAFGISIN